MIQQRDIVELARRYQVPKATVEKDWALGHFIDGIFAIEDLRSKLIFKGGTALHKCWFEDYRFSEDLDFTATDPSFSLTSGHLNDLCSSLTAKIGMQVHLQSLRELIHNNLLMGYEAIIKFWGPDHSRNIAPPEPSRWTTSVKIEITIHEIIKFDPVLRSIRHPFTDQLTYNEPIPCYSLEEVVAEKLRALIQRSYTAPRDYYDLWYIL